MGFVVLRTVAAVAAREAVRVAERYFRRYYRRQILNGLIGGLIMAKNHLLSKRTTVEGVQQEAAEQELEGLILTVVVGVVAIPALCILVGHIADHHAEVGSKERRYALKDTTRAQMLGRSRHNLAGPAHVGRARAHIITKTSKQAGFDIDLVAANMHASLLAAIQLEPYDSTVSRS